MSTLHSTRRAWQHAADKLNLIDYNIKLRAFRLIKNAVLVYAMKVCQDGMKLLVDLLPILHTLYNSGLCLLGKRFTYIHISYSSLCDHKMLYEL